MADRTEAELLALAHPRPWNWMWIGGNASGGGHVYLTDANGRKIAAVWGGAEEKAAAVELIVALVNGFSPLSPATGGENSPRAPWTAPAESG